MPDARLAFSLLLAQFLSMAFIFALAITDPSDVQALEIMYKTLNSPSQLTGWTVSGGDPCGESWRGIACEGSAVVSIQLRGLGLNGTMGYLLSNLMSLRELDLSDNKISDAIPYQLPFNLTSLNVARNNLSGNLPYSFSAMVSLKYLNVSHNALSMSTGEVFSGLANLRTLDLSFNGFSGDLLTSFGSLSSLSSLFLQNNEFTSSLNALVGLPLNTLNVANNHFSGWIPHELSSIPNFIYDGNSFENGPDPPLLPYTYPPSSDNNHHYSGSEQGSDSENSDGGNKGLTTGAIVGVILASVFLALIMLLALAFFIQKRKKKDKGARTFRGSLPFGTINGTPHMQEEHVVTSAAVTTDLKLPPAMKLNLDRLPAKSGSVRQMKPPIIAIHYTVASLQSATNSFSQEFLIGEGSVGRVYKADFQNGKMAIKKIDNAALSLQEEENFLEAVSNMSRLRHPNVVTLTGYCAENGQRLLVHEYIGNGNLHDMIHFVEDSSNTLSWSGRVKIALGAARALEYLHEVCLPSVVHRNFKSANILLDEELNPHLSDCGLAAMTPNTKLQLSSQMMESFGYSPPESALSGIYTVKSDVYSFGVVVLELLTGRKPLDRSRVKSEQLLVRWASPQLHDIDALAKMVDPAMNGMYPAKSLSGFADIVALCLQPEPEFRPAMTEVVQALVRLMQRSTTVKRRSMDKSGFGGQRTPDCEAIDMPC